MACIVLGLASVAQKLRAQAPPTLEPVESSAGLPPTQAGTTNPVGVDTARRNVTARDSGLRIAKDVWTDHRNLWASPLRMRQEHLTWLLPSASVLALALGSDVALEHHLPENPTVISRSRDLSNAGAATAIGLAGSLYFWGRAKGNSHAAETGLLSMEAVASSYMMTTELKYLAGRARPLESDGRGRFREAGVSFPSEHAAAAWSVATVLAHEYPGWMTKLLAYGGASAVSATRITARQHYVSDVLVGSALGYIAGLQANHRANSGADDIGRWGVFEKSESQLFPEQLSSTYIELDSWIYPAIERLSALGFVQSAFLGLRPWTRRAVSNMLKDVDDANLDDASASLVHSLKAELDEDDDQSGSLSLDRIYFRSQNISGMPLNDGLHIGQTIGNDFGRPYGQGWQQISGFETRGERGRFAFFARGEYQHSPGIPGQSSALEQVIASQDGTPVRHFDGRPSQESFRLLDTYVSMHLLGHEISVGKQSYWWGPDSSAAMLLSNNAEPFYSARISRTEPLYIPVLSKFLGPFRYEGFLGKLSGHSFPRQPFFHGEKVSFRPTENLEFGFSRNAVFAGEGVAPMTLGTFWRSFTSTSSGTGPGFTLRESPGARHANFDFRYRLPFLRDWATLYADSVVHDDVSPIDAPRGAAVMPGIYLAKFPAIPKLDLHVEGGTTDTPTDRSEGGRFYYYQSVYRDGYTNKGYLLSSWLGREGTGGQAWATYWINPDRSIQAGYRTLQVSPYFVPGGVSQQDSYVKFRSAWENGLGLEFLIQVERWKAPLLADGPQLNVTTQIQLAVSPARTWKRKRR